jgi:hypothetical protein
MSAAEGFFNWGQIPISQEVGEDILGGLTQGKRTMYYNRSYGAGVPDFENTPISLLTIVTLRLEVAKFMSTRNAVVTGGQIVNGVQYADRRAMTSQNVVQVTDAGGGALDVTVPYFLLADLSSLKQAKTTIGGGSR